MVPCLNLCHGKVNITSLEAASERATRTKQRRKRMEESSAGASGPSEIDTSETVTHLIFVTSAVWKLKLIVCYMMTKCANKNVKTNIVELCTGKSKLIAVNFLQEVTFYLMMRRCIITRGCQIVNFYCQLLNCHEVLCGWR